MRKIKINLLIGFILLLLAVQVFSYDNLKTHPQLTDAAATIYNNQADQKLTKEQINWLVEGSIAEDTDPRYVNHYYNPVNGQGLSGWDKYKGIPIPVIGSPAKLWAKYQASASGDYSISAVFRNYKDGDLKRAYQGIGHIMHLIQDMAVPAHTRNDSHAEGDPYEKWAEQYGLINLSKVDYIQTNNVDEIFDELADYSNKNFYSLDSVDFKSINDYNIKNEIIDGKQRRYLLNKISGIEYRILYSKNPDSILPVYQVDGDFKVHLDYWNMLYPKAVGYSAGAIDYFIKGFKEIDQAKAQERKLSLWQKAETSIWKGVLKLSDTISYTLGDSLLAGRNTIADGWDKISGASGAAYDFSALALQSSGEVIADTADKSIKAGEKAYQKTKEETTKALNAAKQESGKVLSAIEKVAQSVKHPLTADDLLKTKQAVADEKAKIGANALQFPAGDCSGAGDCVEEKIPPTPLTKRGDLPPAPLAKKSEAPDNKATNKNFNFLFAGGSNIEVNQEIKDIAAKAAPAPQIEIISKPPLISSSTAVDFQFLVSNENDFQCKLDSSEWQKCQEQISFQDLSQGAHSLKLLALNSAGDIASSSYDWLADTVAPAAAITDLPSEHKESGFPVNWDCDEDQSNPNAECGAKQSCGCFFDVQYKINNGEWISWINETENTGALFAAAAGKGDKIYFRVRAKDAAGNLGGWNETAETKISPSHIVISEIYFNEFNNGSEWIELYNPADNDFNIGNWTIDTKTYNADITLPVNAVIIKNGYYLIGDAASNVWNPDKADWPAPDHIETMTLANSDGWARLKNSAGETVDSAGWKKNGTVDVYETVPINIANLAKGQSVERKAFATSTYELMASNGAHELKGNSYDTDNNQNDFIIRLAPDPQNSQSPTEPREPLAAEAVDDLIVSHPFTGSNSVTLHWTAPKNANAQIGAHYDLRYQIKSGECALNSDWDKATAIASSILPVPGNESEVQEVKISGLNKETEYCFAVKTFNGEAWSNISNQVSVATLPEIVSCTEIPADEQEIIQTDKLLLSSSPYCSDIYHLTIAQGQSLTIEPGVVIKLKEESNITVKGELRAIGLPDQPIVFTSYYDNEKGGKVSEAEHIAARGDWGFIATGPGGKLFMENAIINYGGYTAYSPAMMRVFSTSGGVIYISDGSAEIKNCRIYDNIGGVDVLYNANVDISLSDIFNNQLGGILINSKNSTVNIEQSKIHNNSGEGIRITYTSNSEISVLNSEINNNHFGIINDSYTNEPITAINNWWGDNSGPYHETLNPHGQGNAVGGAVLFEPWTGK